MSGKVTKVFFTSEKRLFPWMNKIVLAGFIALLLGSCSHSSNKEQPEISYGHDLPEPKIQYLGVGGWLLHWRGEGVLLAPSFSNPATLNIEGWPPLWVEANKQKIDRYMPKADDVTMLLVGHGHYDHLLDVPWVMRKYTPHATLYGSETVVQILHSMRFRNKVENEHWTWVDPDRLKIVNSEMATVQNCEGRQEPSKPGTWIPSSGGHIRAMPIQSMHASHILGHTFADGGYPTDLNEVPTSVFGWKQGQSMAWLIDLLDDNHMPVYRIHFQDSAAAPPCGILQPLPDDNAVDVEILGVGSWENVDNYPDELLKRTRPRLVLLGHWENFFGNDPGDPKPRPLFGHNVIGMQKRVDKVLQDAAIHATVSMPAPLYEVALPPAKPPSVPRPGSSP